MNRTLAVVYIFCFCLCQSASCQDYEKVYQSWIDVIKDPMIKSYSGSVKVLSLKETKAIVDKGHKIVPYLILKAEGNVVLENYTISIISEIFKMNDELKNVPYDNRWAWIKLKATKYSHLSVPKPPSNLLENPKSKKNKK